MRTHIDVGQYVKAIYDFSSTLRGEVNLKRGDVIHVSKVIDQNWLCGKVGEKEGNFPAAFVEPINIPPTEPGQRIYLATENFPSLQDGDLEFRKGDVILGTQKIDGNWWHGKNKKQLGIFPLTHVMELETSSPRQISETAKQKGGFIAKALVDSTAQLDEELSFRAGDLISVTEIIDCDWYFGENNGKSGMFLAACVDVLEDMKDDNENKESPQIIPSDHASNGSINKVTPNSTSVSDTVFDSKKSNRHSSSHRKDSASSIASADNVSRSSSYTSENTRSSDTDITPYCKTLYPFQAQNSDELSFSAGEIVTLIRHVDDQWVEGELDGNIGLFPVNYVDIIVDCPNISSTISNGSPQPDIIATTQSVTLTTDNVVTSTIDNASSESSVEEQYGLVLYNYKAESQKDLTLSEGDTITILKQIDENWFYAKDEDGNLGMCPTSYIDVIPLEPPCLSNSASTESFSKLESEANDNAMGKTTLLDSVNSSLQSEQKIVKTEVSEKVTDDCQCKVESVKTDKHLENRKSLSPRVKPPVRPKPVLKPKPAISSIQPRTGTLSPAFTTHQSQPNRSLHSIKELDKNVINSLKSDSANLSSHNLDADERILPETNILKGDNLCESDISTVEARVRSSSKSDDTTNENRLSSGSETSDRGQKLSKTFSDIDLGGTLDSVIQGELQKAKEESDAKSRSSSSSSKSSITSTGSKSSSVCPAGQTEFLCDPVHIESTAESVNAEDITKSQTFTAHSPVHNVTQSNFNNSPNINIQRVQSEKGAPRSPNNRLPRHSSYDGFNTPPTRRKYDARGYSVFLEEDFSSQKFSWETFDDPNSIRVGNSTFFTNDTVNVPNKSSNPPMRPAPIPPNRAVSPIKDQFNRKPSLRKAPPPRPTGPRIAPAPSKTPLEPVRSPSVKGPSSLNKRSPSKYVRTPSRPAPPRPPPGTRSKRSRKSSSTTELISFSPEDDMLDDYMNEEVVEDLKRRISEMEHDLEKCKKSKEELEQMAIIVSDEEKDEIMENIEFYTANIQGLDEELEKLKENLQSISPCKNHLEEEARQRLLEEKRLEEERQRVEEEKRREEMKLKRKEKRENVISEIMQTEKEFLFGLQLCLHTFATEKSDKGITIEKEKEMILGNMEEIAEVSQQLLNSLENAVNGKDFEDIAVGPCFTRFSEDMKNTYAPYCRNHDEVIDILQKLKQMVHHWTIRNLVRRVRRQIFYKCSGRAAGNIMEVRSAIKGWSPETETTLVSSKRQSEVIKDALKKVQL